MKPGFKSTEFYLTLVAQLAAFAVLLGFIPSSDKETVENTLKNLVEHSAALITLIYTTLSYIKSRTAVKTVTPILLCCLFLSFHGSTQAQEVITAGDVTVVDVTGLNGQYLLTINGDTVTVAKMKVVKPVPGPNPTPVPPQPVNKRVAAVKAAASAVIGDSAKASTAQELSLLYSEINKRVANGEVKDQETFLALVKASTDMLLSQKKVADAWSGVRAVITDQITVCLQEGGGLPELVVVLKDASDGLKASSPVTDVKAINIELIIQIIKLILELLNKQSSGVLGQ